MVPVPACSSTAPADGGAEGGKSKKEKKEKGGKEKKEKKEKKESEGAAGEKAAPAAGEEERAQAAMNVVAFHILIAARLSGGHGLFTERDMKDAAEWLGLELHPDANLLTVDLGKAWPRMLKHMAAAVEEGSVPAFRIAELWELGSRLSQEGSAAARLQTALEKSYERQASVRKEVSALQARRRRVHCPAPAKEKLEESLEERPLEVFGRPPAFRREPCRPAELLLFDEARRSFAYRWPGLARGGRFLQQLRESTPWCQLQRADGTTKRSTCWFVRGGLECDYAYGSERVVRSSADVDEGRFHRIMEDLTEKTMRLVRPDLPEEAWPNSANLNLYADGAQACGWHADDEALFLGKEQDCCIVSLSLGAAREFCLAPRESWEEGTPGPDESATTWVTLEDGDILTMEGLCQKHYVHSVPAASGAGGGPRINVTWRWIKQPGKRRPSDPDDVSA